MTAMRACLQISGSSFLCNPIRHTRSFARTNYYLVPGCNHPAFCGLSTRYTSAPNNLKAASGDLAEAVSAEDDYVDNRIPVTVITGFLGSGKTTLLNNILTKDHGHRIAVIENEFGEIDIDSELVSIQEDLAPGTEQIMMLNNGCLCCTVRDDLIEMLEKLWERRTEFDRILIETTGLADPAPIIQTFFLEEKVAETMKLDGVVTLVDAKHIGFHLDEQKPDGTVNEALQQIAYADRIILNKTDLFATASSQMDLLDELEERLKTINTMAPIVRTQKAQVDVDYVLGVGGFDLERVEDQVVGSGEKKDEEEHHHHHHHQDHDHECTPECTHPSHENHHHHHHHHHHHDDAVGSISITLDGDLDLNKVNYWLGGMLEVRGNDLYRLKGVLAIDGFDRRFVFQGVHMLFEGMPDRPWKEGEPRVSKMVFIGRDLERDIIEEGFRQCLKQN